jgi:hypothetical protein
MMKLGSKHSEESKIKISKSRIGKHYPKLSAARKGQKSAFLGRHHSEESNRKNSEAHKGKRLTEEHKRKISLKCRDISGKNNPIYGIDVSGDKNPAWKGGITSENQKIKNSNIYRNWRKSVYQRDHYTCLKCKRIAGILRAHHKYNFADFPDLRFDVSNGATLCKGCHDEFHVLFGKIDNNPEQLIKFLSC